MYFKHFGLKAQPFQLTPDIGFLFMSEAHTRAKAYMDYTVWNREGFVVITGEIGCGKTTLIQKVLSELDENVVVAKVFQTQLDEVEFLQAMLVDFGLSPFNAKKVELLDMLNTFIFEHFRTEIVRVINDQHDLLALHELLQYEGIEHVEQLNFLRVERTESEIHEHRLQKLDFVKLRLEHLRNNQDRKSVV